MPYKTVGDLPTNVRQMYAPKAQRAFKSAFNETFAHNGDEHMAFAIAHHAAQGVHLEGTQPKRPNFVARARRPGGAA